MRLTPMEKRSLGPVIDEGSRLLILGTMPGDESLGQCQYYANPRNQFWTILARVYEELVGLTYSDRVTFLMGKRLALWDVLQSAERRGSTDRTIKNPVANDFKRIFGQFLGLRAIAFNGGNAESLFRRLVDQGAATRAYSHLQRFVLPSSSPSPGQYTLTLEEKIVKWRILLDWQ